MWPFDNLTIKEAIQIAKDRGLIRAPIDWDLDFKDRNGNRILIGCRFTKAYIKVNGILVAGDFVCDFGKAPEIQDIVSLVMIRVRGLLGSCDFIDYKGASITSAIEGTIKKKTLSENETLQLIEVSLYRWQVNASVTLSGPEFSLFRYVRLMSCEEFQVPVWTGEGLEDVAF